MVLSCNERDKIVRVRVTGAESIVARFVHGCIVVPSFSRCGPRAFFCIIMYISAYDIWMMVDEIKRI